VPALSQESLLQINPGRDFPSRPQSLLEFGG
jgi:hypothetical protein